MRLTTEERSILDGSKGEGAALAMKILAAIGEAFDAPGLVPIRRAHVALSNQEADLWFAEKLARAGGRCVVPPTVNPGFCLEFFFLPQDACRMRMHTRWSARPLPTKPWERA